MNRLNCKQGDLAMIVHPDNFPVCIQCVLFVGDVYVSEFEQLTNHGDIWKIDKPVLWTSANHSEVARISYCPDKYLMPLSGYKPDQIAYQTITQAI